MQIHFLNEQFVWLLTIRFHFVFFSTTAFQKMNGSSTPVSTKTIPDSEVCKRLGNIMSKTDDLWKSYSRHLKLEN